MTNDRKTTHQIRQANGGSKCFYCKLILKEEREVVTDLYARKERHYHLFSSGQCEGWIYHEWPFITTLLYRLTDIAGDDFKEIIDTLITLWESPD